MRAMGVRLPHWQATFRESPNPKVRSNEAKGSATWAVVKGATSVPVVYVFSADPVEAGFAPSLSRPGGNATGLTLMSVELNGKRLELLHEILPLLRRTTIIANPDHRGEHLERRGAEASARRLGITIPAPTT